MDVSLYQAAAALNANRRWQETIADNLAASSIPGYKKQELSFGAVAAGFMPASSPGATRFSLPHAASSINFQPGELAQGYLEMSNVKVVEEMVNRIVAQRAYEVNSKAVQASDEMMQMSNNLKR